MVIGVFIAQLEDAYQSAVWRGITARAAETGNGVIGFVGQRIGAPAANESVRNFAYRLARRGTVDGLIVLTSTFGSYRGINDIQALLAEFDLPKVSVGVNIPGIPGVSVQAGPAMAELVRHVVHDHRRRRIALLAGPPLHPESLEREAVFRAELSAAGLPFDEDLLANGSFLTASGEECARGLIERGKPFDALVCLNDCMAIGAMAALGRAGLRVPEDVLVTGFDDVADAQWRSPPLTTVAQPLAAMGRQSVDMIAALLNGAVPASRRFECRFVRRQSCGCPPLRPSRGEAAADGPDEPCGGRLRALAQGGDHAGYWNELHAALAGADGGERAGPDNAEPDPRWFEIVRRSLAGIPGTEELLADACALVASREPRAQARARIEAREQQQLMRTLSASLSGSFSLKTMVAQLSEGLNALSVRYGFLALFADISRPSPTPSPRARLVMAAGADGSRGALGDYFPSHRLLPAAHRGLFRRGAWMLEPLAYQNEALGFLILSGDTLDTAVYENIRDQVSSTVKGSLMMDQIVMHEHELEREVGRRTKELRAVNQDLLAGLKQRRVLEREIQEISDRTMQAIGQDLHDDLCQHLAGISMYSALLENELRDIHPSAVDALERIRRMLEDSIVRTRQIARGLYPPGLEENGIVAVLEDLVDRLNRPGKAPIELRVEPNLPSVDATRALQLVRIVQESLSNAMRYSGTDRIAVRLYHEQGCLVVEVRDFGCGIEADPGRNAPPRGMGLRIMRYRAESIGAGLAIDPGNPGTRVECRLPLKGEEGMRSYAGNDPVLGG